MASLGYKYEYNSPIHPQLFGLWLAIGSIVMAFAGLTSAYIVKKGAGFWVEFNLPQYFFYSTFAVIASSITMQLAYVFYKKMKVSLAILCLLATFIFGLIFLQLQFGGWQQMTEGGIFLNGNPSGSFVYLISGLHFAHIVGGLVAMFVLLIKSTWRNRKPVKKLLDEVNPDRHIGFKLMATYWHFVGILWIYLYLFLKFY